MAERKKSKVSDNKVKEVKKLAELIDSNNTIMLASIKGLPTRQFQKIKKTLSDKVIIKVRALNTIPTPIVWTKLEEPGLLGASTLIK